MPTFVFNLSRKDNTHRLVGSCSIIGETHGFKPHWREFADEREATKALVKAGIDQSRCGRVVEDAPPDWACSMEISQNEAQKLDVLWIDSTE
jgi:hypothetical protein